MGFDVYRGFESRIGTQGLGFRDGGVGFRDKGPFNVVRIPTSIPGVMMTELRL